MPWEIRQDGDEYCVHRSDTGEREACHGTEAEAEEHVAALYASEDGKAVEEESEPESEPEPEEVPDGNALKALSKTDTELRVGNYLVVFGGRDLEGIASPRTNPDGSTGEYFTKSTEFDSSYTSMDLVAVDWEHGMAPEDEPGPDDVLGKVDWKTAKIDDKGLFVERVLNRRNRYVQYLEELIDAGLIGNSSEAVPTGIEKGEDGQIKRWPLKRDTLTVTPMEPRMMTENQLETLKSLSERYPALKSLLADTQSDVETEPEADGESAATVADGASEAERLLLEIDIMELEPL